MRAQWPVLFIRVEAFPLPDIVQELGQDVKEVLTTYFDVYVVGFTPV